MLIRQLIAIVVSLTFVFSTLLQFHHHDRMGNIFITLSFVGEIELGFHQHNDCSCHHIHNHGTEPGDCGDDEDCSMHLDMPLSTDTDDWAALPVPVVMNLDFIYHNCFEDEHIYACGTYIVGFIERDVAFLVAPELSSDCRRGPPTLA